MRIEYKFVNGSVLTTLPSKNATRIGDMAKFVQSFYGLKLFPYQIELINMMEEQNQRYKKINEGDYMYKGLSSFMFDPSSIDYGTTKAFTYQFWGERLSKLPEIKRITFDNPTTVVFWNDGSKTIVQCSANDDFDKEYGVTMCFMKKIFGTRSEFMRQVEKGGTKKYQNKKEKKSEA